MFGIIVIMICLSYNLQSGQISVIGQIAGFADAEYHTWSADYSQPAVGTTWPNVYIWRSFYF